MKTLREIYNGGLVVDVHAKIKSIDIVESEFNYFFDALCRVFTDVSFIAKTNDEMNLLKNQWLKGFIDAKLGNPDFWRAGLSVARLTTERRFPKIGQFIFWCEQGVAMRNGVPTASELIELLNRYRNCFDREKFEFGSNANYWLVTELHQKSRLSSDVKTFEIAKELIKKLTIKIMDGFVIPKPTITIPEKVKSQPLTREQGLSKIHEIKRKLGLKYVLT